MATGWTDSAVEWAGGLQDLNTFGLCPDDEFGAACATATST